MRVGSLFSGAAGFEMGLEAAGFSVVWQCEIEPHAQAVLRKRFPNATLYDDVRSVGRANLDPVNLVCGGFPCQDVSVAGNRAGLAGARSGLFYEFARVVAELVPEWILLENVPGLLSSDGGRDMGTVLGKLGELGYGFAYRVLDAQFFGVPQRRRRVFIVGRSGGRCPGEVLFEPESLRGNSPPSRATREDVAGTLGGGAQARGWADDTDRMTFVPARTLTAPVRRQDGETETFVAHTLRAEGFDASEDGTGRGTPLVTGFNARQDPNSWRDRSGPLDTDGSTQAIAWNAAQITSKANRTRVEPGPPAPTLDGHGQVHTGVRRLTPRECERLMGWPDDWTRYGIKPDGKEYELADGPRYRLCGNGVVASVAKWIGRRIAAAKWQERAA